MVAVKIVIWFLPVSKLSGILQNWSESREARENFDSLRRICKNSDSLRTVFEIQIIKIDPWHFAYEIIYFHKKLPADSAWSHFQFPKNAFATNKEILLPASGQPVKLISIFIKRGFPPNVGKGKKNSSSLHYWMLCYRSLHTNNRPNHTGRWKMWIYLRRFW